MLTIGRLDWDQLHSTWLKAFSDYAVDASHVTEELLHVRAVKNSVDRELSVGAFENSRMVGFTLLGIDRWQNELAAFDAGTGIVPEFRGRGLAKQMFDHATPKLRERGVQLFLLEVIQGNRAAIRAYSKAGFEITREFSCFELAPGNLRPTRPLAKGVSVRAIDRGAVAALADQVDWLPSWENSFQAIHQIPDELMIFGAIEDDQCVGSIVYSPLMNWIMSLVVHKAHRRRTIASALLHQLIEQLAPEPPTLKLINVPKSDQGMTAFLAQLGFKHWIDQYEMERRI